MFPETTAQEAFAERYERIRYELSKFSPCNVAAVIQYLRKYRNKKYSADPAIISYFSRHRSSSAPGIRPGIPTGQALRISMVGDIMWMRKGWGSFLSHEVLSFLSQRDIALGNLETPVSPKHRVIECLPDLLSFNSPATMLDHVAPCFTALSVVNNHCLDQGVGGLRATIDELDSRHILHAGARVQDRGREYTLIRKNGSTVAFLAYAWGLNRGKDRRCNDEVHLNLMNLCDPAKPIDYSLVEEHIRRARSENAGLIVCSLHWGHEFEMYPTRRMMAIARQLVARGVDVIMGHHPHVVQPFEIIEVNADRPPAFDNVQDLARTGYRRAVIAYSLGNFVSAMYTRECRQSVICNIDLVRNQNGLAIGSVACTAVYCTRKRRGGETGAYVVDILQELGKGPGGTQACELHESHQDITARLRALDRGGRIF